MELFLAIYMGVLSLVTFIAYGQDKKAAKHKGRRTPESSLHLFALAGGWPGAFLAQRWYGHKRQKRSFMATYWLMVFINLVLLALIYLVSRDDSIRTLAWG